ncbi:MAG: hypothetical protein EXR21_01920 [Flavobacteriaceae bacterium]|nr:hypothetical protein [Flavobacteriaceae bacterium]
MNTGSPENQLMLHNLKDLLEITDLRQSMEESSQSMEESLQSMRESLQILQEELARRKLLNL